MKRRVLALLATAVILVTSTITAFADTETGLIGQYNFDGNLKNEVTGEEAVLTGKLINASATGDEKAAYVSGVTSDAILLDGLDSAYGVEILDGVPDTNTFTLSYDVFYTAYTIHTPTMFLVTSWEEANAAWASFGVGWQTSLAYAAGVWVRNVATSNPAVWVDGWNAGGTPGLVDENGNWNAWTNITYVVNEGVVTVYVDGEDIGLVPSGFTAQTAIINTVDESTRLFVGVNAWDTPLSGAIDNLYIYDRALTADDVDELLDSREYDIAKPLEHKVTESESVQQGGSAFNGGYISNTENVTNNEDDDSTPIVPIVIAVVAVVVVVIVVILVVVNSKKKSKSDDDDDDDFFM